MKSGDIFAIMNSDKFSKARIEHKVWNNKVKIGVHGPAKIAKREIEIDTAFVYDIQEFETGIKDGYWHIVERYPDEKSAEKGHEKWLQWVNDNPDKEIPDPLGDAY